MTAQIVEQVEFFSEAQLESLEFLPEELEAIEAERVPNLDSISFEDIAEDLEVVLEARRPSSRPPSSSSRPPSSSSRPPSSSSRPPGSPSRPPGSPSRPPSPPPPPIFIISSHGIANFRGRTNVPRDTTVHFYTPFGQEMSNRQGFALQRALINRRPTRGVALWNTGQHGPEISLRGDMRTFRSGIIRSARRGHRQFIYNLRPNQSMTLSQALRIIRNRQRRGRIHVHCLFCLA